MASAKARLGSRPHLWALSDTEINNYYKNTKLYLGTKAKDELPRCMALAKRKRGALVVNMGDLKTGGSHWVCIMLHPKKTIYFDSFGCECPKQVLDFMRHRVDAKGNPIPSYYNDRQVQNLKSESCGWFCMMMLNECVLDGKDILDVIPDTFTFDPVRNERSLEAFWEKALAKNRSVV